MLRALWDSKAILKFPSLSIDTAYI